MCKFVEFFEINRKVKLDYLVDSLVSDLQSAKMCRMTVFTALVLLSMSATALQTFYVDAADGNDGNSGMTPEDAFATIVHAMGEMSDDMDLYLSEGTHTVTSTLSQSLGDLRMIGDSMNTTTILARMSGSNTFLIASSFHLMGLYNLSITAELQSATPNYFLHVSGASEYENVRIHDITGCDVLYLIQMGSVVSYNPVFVRHLYVSGVRVSQVWDSLIYWKYLRASHSDIDGLYISDCVVEYTIDMGLPYADANVSFSNVYFSNITSTISERTGQIKFTMDSVYPGVIYMDRCFGFKVFINLQSALATLVVTNSDLISYGGSPMSQAHAIYAVNVAVNATNCTIRATGSQYFSIHTSAYERSYMSNNSFIERAATHGYGTRPDGYMTGQIGEYSLDWHCEAPWSSLGGACWYCFTCTIYVSPDGSHFNDGTNPELPRSFYYGLMGRPISVFLAPGVYDLQNSNYQIYSNFFGSGENVTVLRNLRYLSFVTNPNNGEDTHITSGFTIDMEHRYSGQTTDVILGSSCGGTFADITIRNFENPAIIMLYDQAIYNLTLVNGYLTRGNLFRSMLITNLTVSGLTINNVTSTFTNPFIEIYTDNNDNPNAVISLSDIFLSNMHMPYDCISVTGRTTYGYDISFHVENMVATNMSCTGGSLLKALYLKGGGSLTNVTLTNIGKLKYGTFWFTMIEPAPVLEHVSVNQWSIYPLFEAYGDTILSQLSTDVNITLRDLANTTVAQYLGGVCAHPPSTTHSSPVWYNTSSCMVPLCGCCWTDIWCSTYTATLYVSVEGSDENKGTIDSPKRTFLSAHAAAVVNGNPAIVLSEGEFEVAEHIDLEINIRGSGPNTVLTCIPMERSSSAIFHWQAAGNWSVEDLTISCPFNSSVGAVAPLVVLATQNTDTFLSVRGVLFEDVGADSDLGLIRVQYGSLNIEDVEFRQIVGGHPIYVTLDIRCFINITGLVATNVDVTNSEPDVITIDGASDRLSLALVVHSVSLENVTIRSLVYLNEWFDYLAWDVAISDIAITACTQHDNYLILIWNLNFENMVTGPVVVQNVSVDLSDSPNAVGIVDTLTPALIDTLMVTAPSMTSLVRVKPSEWSNRECVFRNIFFDSSDDTMTAWLWNEAFASQQATYSGYWWLQKDSVYGWLLWINGTCEVGCFDDCKVITERKEWHVAVGGSGPSGQCAGEAFSSIAAALEQASSGDALVIHAGYWELPRQVSNLDVYGDGPSTVVSAPGLSSDAMFAWYGGGVFEVKDLKINGTIGANRIFETDGAVVNVVNIVVEDCTLPADGLAFVATSTPTFGGAFLLDGVSAYDSYVGEYFLRQTESTVQDHSFDTVQLDGVSASVSYFDIDIASSQASVQLVNWDLNNLAMCSDSVVKVGSSLAVVNWTTSVNTLHIRNSDLPTDVSAVALNANVTSGWSIADLSIRDNSPSNSLLSVISPVSISSSLLLGHVHRNFLNVTSDGPASFYASNLRFEVEGYHMHGDWDQSAFNQAEWDNFQSISFKSPGWSQVVTTVCDEYWTGDYCADYELHIYVANEGSDANDGLTPETALRTIAAAEALNPTILHLAAGDYTVSATVDVSFDILGDYDPTTITCSGTCGHVLNIQGVDECEIKDVDFIEFTGSVSGDVIHSEGANVILRDVCFRDISLTSGGLVNVINGDVLMQIVTLMDIAGSESLFVFNCTHTPSDGVLYGVYSLLMERVTLSGGSVLDIQLSNSRSGLYHIRYVHGSDVVAPGFINIESASDGGDWEGVVEYINVEHETIGSSDQSISSGNSHGSVVFNNITIINTGVHVERLVSLTAPVTLSNAIFSTFPDVEILFFRFVGEKQLALPNVTILLPDDGLTGFVKNDELQAAIGSWSPDVMRFSKATRMSPESGWNDFVDGTCICGCAPNCHSVSPCVIIAKTGTDVGLGSCEPLETLEYAFSSGLLGPGTSLQLGSGAWTLTQPLIRVSVTGESTATTLLTANHSLTTDVVGYVAMFGDEASSGEICEWQNLTFTGAFPANEFGPEFLFTSADAGSGSVVLKGVAFQDIFMPAVSSGPSRVLNVNSGWAVDFDGVEVHNVTAQSVVYVSGSTSSPPQFVTLLNFVVDGFRSSDDSVHAMVTAFNSVFNMHAVTVRDVECSGKLFQVDNAGVQVETVFSISDVLMENVTLQREALDFILPYTLQTNFTIRDITGYGLSTLDVLSLAGDSSTDEGDWNGVVENVYVEQEMGQYDRSISYLYSRGSLSFNNITIINTGSYHESILTLVYLTAPVTVSNSTFSTYANARAIYARFSTNPGHFTLPGVEMRFPDIGLTGVVDNALMQESISSWGYAAITFYPPSMGWAEYVVGTCICGCSPSCAGLTPCVTLDQVEGVDSGSGACTSIATLAYAFANNLFVPGASVELGDGVWVLTQPLYSITLTGQGANATTVTADPSTTTEATGFVATFGENSYSTAFVWQDLTFTGTFPASNYGPELIVTTDTSGQLHPLDIGFYNIIFEDVSMPTSVEDPSRILNIQCKQGAVTLSGIELYNISVDMFAQVHTAGQVLLEVSDVLVDEFQSNGSFSRHLFQIQAFGEPLSANPEFGFVFSGIEIHNSHFMKIFEFDPYKEASFNPVGVVENLVVDTTVMEGPSTAAPVLFSTSDHTVFGGAPWFLSNWDIEVTTRGSEGLVVLRVMDAFILRDVNIKVTRSPDAARYKLVEMWAAFTYFRGNLTNVTFSDADYPHAIAVWNSDNFNVWKVNSWNSYLLLMWPDADVYAPFYDAMWEENINVVCIAEGYSGDTCSSVGKAYVSTGGSNLNSGVVIDQPMSSLWQAYALCNVAPYCTIVLLDDYTITDWHVPSDAGLRLESAWLGSEPTITVENVNMVRESLPIIADGVHVVFIHVTVETSDTVLQIDPGTPAPTVEDCFISTTAGIENANDLLPGSTEVSGLVLEDANTGDQFSMDGADNFEDFQNNMQICDPRGCDATPSRGDGGELVVVIIVVVIVAAIGGGVVLFFKKRRPPAVPFPHFGHTSEMTDYSNPLHSKINAL